MNPSATKTIGTILKHDNKVTSYKIALLRAINDIVLSFPNLLVLEKNIAIPLQKLAQYWFAYYWPFFDEDQIILQGPKGKRDGKLMSDMAFRKELGEFQSEWITKMGEKFNPADGFFIINEFFIPRKRNTYPISLQKSYDRVIKKISNTIQMPIRYAGEGEWNVFDKPIKFRELHGRCISIPGTSDQDVCLVVDINLWRGFEELSLYIEALCIHEWCLFTERRNEETKYDRGFIYKLLTTRPDNRRPLTWERNQIDILLMENLEFICPWTEKIIKRNVRYDIDHLIPISVYPINELWNLVPSDPNFNAHTKRDRLPSIKRLIIAEPHLKLAYDNYRTIPSTANALSEDVYYRFSGLKNKSEIFPEILATSVVKYIEQIAIARNVARF